jgi:hypothetical protein
MDFHKLLTVALAAALVVLVIIGLLDFDLFFSLVAKVLVVVVVVGAVVMLVRSLFPGK